jgi:hypothetical protein
MNQETISIAEAKRTFSELLGKVAYGKKGLLLPKGENQWPCYPRRKKPILPPFNAKVGSMNPIPSFPLSIKLFKNGPFTGRES